MFCSECGAELKDGAKFCGKCGTVIEGADDATTEIVVEETLGNDDATAPQAPVTTADTVATESPSSDANAGDTEPAKSRKGLIIGIVVAVVVIAAVIAGVLIWQHMEYEKAHEPVLLYTKTVVADATVEETSGVPINVRGIDLDDNEVDENILITSADESIELLRGAYTVTLLGDPVGDAGYVYTNTTKEMPVVIEEDRTNVNGKIVEGASSEAADLELPMEFTVIPPQDVTDEQLAAIRAWMEEFGLTPEEIDGFIDSATQVRQTELDRIAEEERIRAEEEARAKAEALRQAAFGSFPANFYFSSGVGGWGTSMTIQPDGSFTGQWHDGDMGPNPIMMITEFAGSFTVLEQVNEKTFKLQLDEVHATHGASTTVKDGIEYEYTTDMAYGLGAMTSTPVQGWTLYMPGTSSSVLNDQEKGWIYGLGPTLTRMVLTNGGEFTWEQTDDSFRL